MVNDKIESANMTKIVLNKGSLLQQRVEVIMKTPVFLLIGSFVSFNYGIHFVWSSFKSFALTAGDDKSLCRATWLETDQHASHSLDLWFALTGKLRSKPRGDQLSTGSVCSISQRSAPLRSSWTRRRLQQRENSQPGRYSQMQRRSETPDKNPPATDSGQEEGERERGKGKGKKKKRWDRQSANCAVDTSGYLKGFSHLSPLHNFKKICFMKSLVWYLSQSSDGSRGVQTRNQ